MGFGSGLLRWASGRRTRWATFALLLALFAVFPITAFFFLQSIRLEEASNLAENQALARGVAGFIEARQDGYLNTLVAYSWQPHFREAVRRRDRAAVLPHLRHLYEAFPGLERPFLADPAGVGWAIYPQAPENYGKSFADRDWYRGVSREWRPYISEVFPIATPDRSLVIALAVPVRDEAGRVLGILGVHQRLDLIREWLLPIRIPDGDLYVVDGKGRFVFHRTRTGPEQLGDYARVPAVQKVLRGEEGIAEVKNPVEGESRLVAYQPLPALGWGLVVQRDKDLTLRPTRHLILVSVGAGSILTVGLALLGIVALRRRQETMAALEALESKTRALQASEEKFRSVTQSAIDAIIAADSRGTIQSWNRGAGAIFGYREEEVLGRPVTMLMPERYRNPHAEALERIRSSGESDRIGRTVEFEGLRKDGSEFPVEISLAAWKTGEDIYYGAIIRDITERKRGEEALRKTHQELEIRVRERTADISRAYAELREEMAERKRAEAALREAQEALEHKVQERTRALQEAQEALVRKERLAALGQLAAGISHELRNPLGVIKNSIYFLNMVLPEEEKVRRHLAILEREVEGATRIVADLLDFTRVKPPKQIPVDLSGLAQEVLQGSPLADNVKVVTDLAADLPRVSLDPEQGKQILGNLVANAIQAMPEGGTLTIEAASCNDGALVAVSDTGVGIPPEHLERIFQPLFTTKAKGIGLGLAITKNLTETNGGTISVESVPGRGSRFVVSFRTPAEEG